MSNSLPHILSGEWWEGFRQDVFQLVAWGYQIKEKEIRTRHLEEDITGLISKGMDEVLDDFHDKLPPRFATYFVDNESMKDDGGILGKDRPRVDILIECSGSRPRTRYRLEAKRCAKNRNSIGWYVKGITAFLERRYAGDVSEAGLLGLMQTDDVQHWSKQLADKLGKDTTLCCESPLTEIDLTPDIPFMTLSHHRRVDASKIILYHAFLDCCPS